MMSFNHRVNTKNLYVTINDEGDRQKIMNMTPTEFPFESGLIVDDGANVLIHASRCAMNFRNGMDSLMRKLKLNEPPTLVTTQNLPDCFMKLFSSKFMDAVKFGMFNSQDYIDKFMDNMERRMKKRNADTMKEVSENGVGYCVREGIIPAPMMSAYEQANKKLKQDELDEVAAAKEMPNGRKLVMYDRRHLRREICSFKGESFNMNTIDIIVGNDTVSFNVGHADLDRKKHYWFYSKEGGFGKTAILTHFKQKTNSSEITDVRNMINVNPDAQWLIVDEVGDQPGTNKCFPFVDMKVITNGDASHYEGNRKSYGAGRAFRPDAQLLFTSNHHPYDVYGKFDQKLKRRFIDPSAAATLKQRLNIVKFDEPGITIYNRDGSYITNGVSLEDDEKTYFRSNYVEDMIIQEPEVVYDDPRVAAARVARIKIIIDVDLKEAFDAYYTRAAVNFMSFDLADVDGKLVSLWTELITLDLINASSDYVNHLLIAEAQLRKNPPGSEAMIIRLQELHTDACHNKMMKVGDYASGGERQ